MEELFLQEYQPLVFAQLKKSIKHGRIAHAYLFEGDKGTGKHELSLWLAKRLFCTDVQEEAPCGKCSNCVRIAQGEHPDVIQIEPDGQMIKVDQIRQLQEEFSKSGFESRLKIFILSQADKMNNSAANSLLKFLEEPVGNFLAILGTESLGRILPTIQSRCQIIHFSPLSKEKLQEKLQEEGLSKETSRLLSHLTNSYHKAVEISQDEWFNETKDAVKRWVNYLLKKDPQAFIFVQKKLLGLAKEKNQQSEIFLLLLFYFQEERDRLLAQGLWGKEINRAIEAALQAQKKLQANVSFQGVAEQFSVKIIYG
ncbi:DNA polymerase III subunit delta' [Enterococcus innesii]|uniref:DNA polymerase III subunit delta' n=1 Tax=Enterococcus TaxID=1350 RepID=UPI0009866A51|nr:DNA polymerase III subunit delta' [Enterococcus faecium]MCO5533634.1 DNA polymerase III subunit delta' [Enterococcus faecium]OOG27277.1 DNA polymerase III subunit delta' [Enterococcus casseliflavus]